MDFIILASRLWHSKLEINNIVIFLRMHFCINKAYCNSIEMHKALFYDFDITKRFCLDFYVLLKRNKQLRMTANNLRIIKLFLEKNKISYYYLYCTPIKFTVQPDCEPPVMYFPDGITVNSGGLQYNRLLLKYLYYFKNIYG